MEKKQIEANYREAGEASRANSFVFCHVSMEAGMSLIRNGAAFENPGPLKVPSCELSHEPTWDGHFWGRGNRGASGPPYLLRWWAPLHATGRFR